MNKTVAILFLEFRDQVSKQIKDLISTLMRHDFEIRNQRDELTFLKKQIDHLSKQEIKKELDGPKEIIELLKRIKTEGKSSFEELGGS
tara:strand:- start:412 stop:675 length:264 start_codon:yes stop_codon:yes gene_type:complete